MHIRKKTYVMTRRRLMPLYNSNEDLKNDLEKFLGILTN